jgi:protoporphyrinogen oxidase
MDKILKYKYLILGAGPAGLSIANRLLDKGETSFLVLEKESEPGGLCRSEIVDGSPLDIGGGHFLDLKNEKVLDYLYKFMPKNEWNEFNRISTIKMDKYEIDYPFESNIWQLPIEKQMGYLISISKAGCNLGKKIPVKFIDWINWKLGSRIANDYMIPYNQKLWSINLNQLGTYWLYKLPDVSMQDTLLSCLEKKPNGKLPAHAKFLYPQKYGYGEVWKRMGRDLGDKIIYNLPVKTVDLNKRIVNGKFVGEKIIFTIPWKGVKFLPDLPNKINDNISSLKYASVRITYDNSNSKTKAHWTYIPDKSLPYHRILYRCNFCSNSKGYWYETNEKRVHLDKMNSNWSYLNKYAYPLNTLEKPKSIKNILEYFSKKGIYGLGRWGEWEHMNSDIAVQKGLDLAEKLVILK